MAPDKGKEFGLSPEIAKLAEKIAKDPASKLFVPLAEEYRKSGMLDEAIQVLSDGLKANPNYMTARVSLGKMLLEKGNIEAAQEEFERVIQAIPDNLFAHKKLAEIYQSIGDRENLLKEYKIILSLSPKDEEVKIAMDELEGRPGPAEAIEKKQGIPSEPEVPTEKEIKAEITEIKTELPPEEEIMKLEEEAPSVSAITPSELPKDWEVEKAEELIEEAVEETYAVEEEEPQEKKEEVVYELPEEAISPEELGIEIPLKMTPVSEGPRTKEMEMIEAYREESTKPEPNLVEAEELATDTLAEIYIKQGLYDKADEIYQRILSSDPENMVIRQKREELHFLMNLIKVKKPGNEEKISKLEAWLKNIEERRR